jgi:hypothetical protein
MGETQVVVAGVMLDFHQPGDESLGSGPQARISRVCSLISHSEPGKNPDVQSRRPTVFNRPSANV